MSELTDEKRQEVESEGGPVTNAEPITLLDNAADMPAVIEAVQDLQRRMGVVQGVDVVTPFLPHD